MNANDIITGHVYMCRFKPGIEVAARVARKKSKDNPRDNEKFTMELLEPVGQSPAGEKFVVSSRSIFSEVQALQQTLVVESAPATAPPENGRSAALDYLKRKRDSINEAIALIEGL